MEQKPLERQYPFLEWEDELYYSPLAAFGPVIATDSLEGIVVAADPITAETELKNAELVSGHIALVERGECDFITKVVNAQLAGATAVLVANNNDIEPSAAFTMTVTSSDDDDSNEEVQLVSEMVSIPAVMIPFAAAKSVTASMELQTSNATVCRVKVTSDIQLAQSLMPSSSSLPYPPPASPSTQNTALLIIDAQNFNDIIEDSTVLENISKLQQRFRNSSCEVLFTAIESLTKDCRDLSPVLLQQGIYLPMNSQESQIIPSVSPLENEIVIKRGTLGVINETLLRILQTLGIKSVFVVGVIAAQSDIARSLLEGGNLTQVTIVSDASISKAAAAPFTSTISTDDVLLHI